MILCPKCGRVDNYKITQCFKKTKYFNENGEWLSTGSLVPYGTRTQPKCLKCGRKVKFFKDAEEVEG